MSILIDFHFDFETRSRLNLKKVGSINYALHESTQATLLTWGFGRTGTIKYWRIGQMIPPEIIDVINHPEKYRFIAFNIAFDFLIWTIAFKRQFPYLNFVRPKLENLEDAMALTTHFRCGNSLDAAAAMLRFPISKDKEGRRIMLKQCKPNSKGVFPELTEAEWESFIKYGIMDTRILRDVYYSMPRLPAPERWAWEWTFKRNLRGIKFDVDLIHAMNDIIEENLPKLTAEFDQCVSFKAKINSPTTLLPYFKQYYPYIENMQADTIRDMLLDKNPLIPPHVRRALELKDLASSTSISKVKCALAQGAYGRIYNLLAYAHAHTKRWAGRGIQIQNFPRPEEDEVQKDKIDFDLNAKDLASIVRARAPHLKDPIGFVKNLLRRMWLPDEGKTFYCGDFSKVEPSVMFWLLGMGDIPKLWYEEMAAAIYDKQISEIDKDSEERQIGKAAALGANYGMGPDKFIVDVAKKTGIIISEEMSKHVIKVFRDKYREIVAFWKDLEVGFRLAIHGQTSSLCNGRVHIMPMNHPVRGVQIRLPSGSHLYYPYAQIKNQKYICKYTGVEKVREVLAYLADENGSLRTKTVYGGLLCEHVISTTSRDILVPAMYRLDEAGFDTLNLVHDEIWGHSEAGREQEFTRLMCINPSWCGMKITADLKSGERYLK